MMTSIKQAGSIANKSLRIWAVTDNKPGHQNQTMGLIQALSQYRDVDVNWSSAVSLAKNLISLTKKHKDLKSTSADLLPVLLIGTGHRTHLTLLALKRKFGGRVVIMMSPSLPKKLFDLCFIPRHDQPQKADNVIETLGAINRVMPPEFSLSNSSQHEIQARDSHSGLILVGGPSKHFLWDSLLVAQEIASLISEKPDIQWVVAGSRRTPIDFYEKIKLFSPDIKIKYPEEVSKNWLPEKMREASKIWVTADSISMVYEALTSGAETGVIRLIFDKPTRVTQEIDRLIAEGRVITYSSKNSVDFELINNDLEPLFEADRCAKILLQKFEL